MMGVRDRVTVSVRVTIMVMLTVMAIRSTVRVSVMMTDRFRVMPTVMVRV